MSGPRAWLIQVDDTTVNELANGGLRKPFWHPADRPGTNPQRGDRVILWQMGRGETAGVVALGVVKEVSERRLFRDQRVRQEGEEAERRAVLMRFTHWFEEARVRRTQLSRDPRFVDFPLFARGGAQGRSPWPVTREQWDAVQENLPVWASLDHPQVTYDVSIDFATTATGPDDALSEFQAVIVARGYERLGLQAQVAGTPQWAEDEYLNPAGVVPDDPKLRLVVWSTRTAGRTAEEAALNTVRLLNSTAQDLTVGDVHVSTL